MKRLTDEQKIEIVRLYTTTNITCAALGRQFKKSDTTIGQMLKRRGVPIRNNMSSLKRVYKVNEHYFDVIDTEAKAYFLGFLYADGCNSENIYRIGLKIQKIDRKVVDYFKIELGSDLPVHEHPVPKKGSMETVSIIIHSPIMSQALAKLGCVSRKSLILRFPTEEQMPSNLLRHFMRGMWDGDGYVTMQKIGNRLQPYIGLCSSAYFCEVFKTKIEQILGLSTHLNICKNNMTCTANITGIEKCLKFCNWMYDDATIYLDRKFNTYLRIQQEFNRRQAEKEKLILEFNGTKGTLKQLCEIYKSDYMLVKTRIVILKWSLEKALLTPKNKCGRKNRISKCYDEPIECKIENVQTSVYIDGRSTMLSDKVIRVRANAENSNWFRVRVSSIEPNGYFIASKV